MKLFVALGLLIAASVSNAQVSGWTYWNGTGHWYRFVHAPNGISWTGAAAAAEQMGGYLASVNSSAENEFIFDNISEPRFWGTAHNGAQFGPWIGLTRVPGPNFRWVSGEPVTFTAWFPGEPNNYQGLEHYAHYMYLGSPVAKWNDDRNVPLSRDTPIFGYVVERDFLRHNLNPTSFLVLRGVSLSGNTGSLRLVDQNYLRIRSASGPSPSYSPLSVLCSLTSIVRKPRTMVLNVRSSSSVTGLRTTIYCYEWDTSTWQMVRSYVPGVTDATVGTALANPARFVNSLTGLVRVRVETKRTTGVVLPTWTQRFDLLQLVVT